VISGYDGLCMYVCVQAQEDAEMLRSVVAPLEDEIKSLKDQLKQAHLEQVYNKLFH